MYHIISVSESRPLGTNQINHKLRCCCFKAVKPAMFDYRCCLNRIKGKKTKRQNTGYRIENTESVN